MFNKILQILFNKLIGYCTCINVMLTNTLELLLIWSITTLVLGQVLLLKILNLPLIIGFFTIALTSNLSAKITMNCCTQCKQRTITSDVIPLERAFQCTFSTLVQNVSLRKINIKKRRKH